MKPCKPGKERDLITGRCKTVKSSINPCKPGKERDPITGRCKTVKMVEPCKKGKERDPETGRCKKIKIAKEPLMEELALDELDLLQPCPPGQKRHPKTRRCRKIKIYKSIKQRLQEREQILQAQEQQKQQKQQEQQQQQEQQKQQAARDIIQRNLQKAFPKLKVAIKAKFLKSICSDAGFCIAFGKENENIKKFFNGFSTFDYAVAPIKRIGAPSANGFVNEITYEHEGYKSNAILKSSVQKNADNLMYEYIVGTEYANMVAKRFPCFVETYGLFKYTSTKTRADMKTKKKITPQTLSGLTPISVDWSVACKESKKLAILIQHLKNPVDIADLNEKYIMHVLFQIYIPLGILADTYTHNDLHLSNVLIYEPVKGKHIKYRYHLPTGIVEFNSPYIAKIIDYGRSFFDNGTINALDVYDDICAAKGCKSCGESTGFFWNDTLVDPDNYISASVRNVSIDLRLLNSLTSWLDPTSSLYGLAVKTVFTEKYGTAEIYDSKWKNFGNKIENVKDVMKWMIVYNHRFPQDPTPFLQANEIGILNIFLDQEMEFVLS